MSNNVIVVGTGQQDYSKWAEVALKIGAVPLKANMHYFSEKSIPKFRQLMLSLRLLMRLHES
jgi:hypothetical protein